MTIIELADALHDLLKKPGALTNDQRVSLVDVEVRALDRDSEIPRDLEELLVVAGVSVVKRNGAKTVLLRLE